MQFETGEQEGGCAVGRTCGLSPTIDTGGPEPEMVFSSAEYFVVV
jgi:hypothetical protein